MDAAAAPPSSRRSLQIGALAALWTAYLAAIWLTQQRYESWLSPLGVVPLVLTGLLFGRHKGLLAAVLLTAVTFAIHMLHGAGFTPSQDLRQNGFRWVIGLALGYGSGALADFGRRERLHARTMALSEEELSRSRSRLAAILDSQDALIVRIDPSNRITYMNDAYQRAFGLRVGETFWVKVHPDDEAAAKACLAQLSAPPYRASVEQRCEVNGEWRSIFWQDSAVLDRDGKVAEIQGVGIDLTERRKAEERLRQSEERYALATQATRDVVWDLELATGRLAWGGAMQHVFGYVIAQLAPDLTSWEERIHPDDRARVAASFSASLTATTNQWQETYRFRRADGTYAFVLDRGFLVRDNAGQAVRAVGAMADVTQEREAAAKANEADRLREIAQFRAQFLNNAAHELATPLTPLKLQLASLRTTLGERDKRAYDLLRRNVDRLAVLVGDLLDAARLQSGRLRMHPHPFLLNDLLSRTVDSFLAQAQEAGVTLGLEVPPALDVEWDEGRVEQVLFNLVHNALKFTPRTGQVQIRAHADAAFVEIEVQDTGIGIGPEHLSQLFQPFTQVHDASKMRVGGTGLGLYVSRGIVEQHGGTLEATSPGLHQGSTFVLRLPRVVHALPTEAPGRPPSPEVPHRNPATSTTPAVHAVP